VYTKNYDTALRDFSQDLTSYQMFFIPVTEHGFGKQSKKMWSMLTGTVPGSCALA